MADESKLIQIRIITLSGAEYIFPDSTEENVKVLNQQLDILSSNLVLANVSQATLLIPMRIIKRIETCKGEGFVKLGKVIWER